MNSRNAYKGMPLVNYPQNNCIEKMNAGWRTHLEKESEVPLISCSIQARLSRLQYKIIFNNKR
jgi:hypothetical protein